MDFSLNKWGVRAHTRSEQEWVSYDPKGNKVECPLRSNGDTRIFVWQSYKENGGAYFWHSHKGNGGTENICMTFTERNVAYFYSEKEAKRCGSIHNIRIMYETKGNNKVFSFGKYKRALCDSHAKLSGTVLLGNWKIYICGSPHMEKECGTHVEEIKYSWDSLRHFP